VIGGVHSLAKRGSTMADDANRRFCEIWDALKRLQDATQGLEIGTGRFVLVPPGEVRLLSFRARLYPAHGGPVALLTADTECVQIEARSAPDGSAPEIARGQLNLDLTDAFAVDDQVLKHPAVVAGLIFDRMEELLQRVSHHTALR
jgi:hypothetical protein